MKFLYLHINKCGGTSILEWMKAHGINHENLGHNIIHASEFEDDFIYFTTVRNPYNRLASHYYQWELNHFWSRDITSPDKMINKLREIDFYNSKMIKMEHLTGGTCLDYRHCSKSPKFFEPCSSWIKGNPGRYRIFKLEEMEKVEDFIKDFAGLKHTSTLAKHRARSTTTRRKTSYRLEYSKENQRFIQEVFKEDFENYGYDI